MVETPNTKKIASSQPTLLFTSADTSKLDASTLNISKTAKLTPLAKTTNPVKPLSFDKVEVSTITSNLIQPLPGTEEEKKDRGADERLVAQFRVKIDDKVFDSSQGQILVKQHPPHVWLHTRRHSEARFVLNDPDASIYASLKDAQTVEVEIGFNNGYRVNKFSGGKIYKYGRIPPDGTIVVAVDAAIALQQNSGPTVTSNGETPDSPNKVEDTSAGVATAGAQVKSTHTWGASFYGKTDNFDGRKTANGEIFDYKKLTCAHKTLPFGTQIRVTYNNKSVVVRVNDRGPFVAGRDIDLSYSAAEAIGLVPAGHGKVKAEILSTSPVSAATKPGEGSGGKPTPTTSATTPKTTTSPIKPTAATTPAPVATPTPITSPAPVATPTPAPTSPARTLDGNDILQEMQLNSTKNKTATTPAELFTLKSSDLKFAKNTSFDTKAEGIVSLQQSQGRVASLEAALRGDVVIARANTIREMSANQASSSNVVLDYGNPSIFIGRPVIFRRTALQMQSALGATTVAGYNIQEKASVGVTVVNPVNPPTDPGKVIAVPEWGSLKMGDPIFPGCLYTWGDATKNGTRVPSKEIMKGIIALAQQLDRVTKELGKGKWNIISWYRDPVSNRAARGKPNSEHLDGNAADVRPPEVNFVTYFLKTIEPNWNGGCGLNEAGRTFHIDVGRRRRWDYGGERKKYGY
jgi:rare lipoprotein A (peptidoglycan hydrolase)